MLPGDVAIGRIDFWLNVAVMAAVWISGIVFVALAVINKR